MSLPKCKPGLTIRSPAIRYDSAHAIISYTSTVKVPYNSQIINFHLPPYQDSYRKALPLPIHLSLVGQGTRGPHAVLPLPPDRFCPALRGDRFGGYVCYGDNGWVGAMPCACPAAPHCAFRPRKNTNGR